MQWPWPLCFGADRCKSLRQFLVPERTSRGTIGSKRFHPLRKPADRPGWGMLVAMRVHSARPLPIPKCSSAVAPTPPAPPAALSPVYTDVVRRESMAVATLIGHFAGGNLAATVSARERNDSRAISRDQAPATTELPTSGHRRYGGAALLVGVVQQVNNPVSVELRRERGLCHAGGRGFESRRSATTCGVSLLAAHSETIQVKDRA